MYSGVLIYFRSKSTNLILLLTYLILWQLGSFLLFNDHPIPGNNSFPTETFLTSDNSLVKQTSLNNAVSITSTINNLLKIKEEVKTLSVLIEEREITLNNFQELPDFFVVTLDNSDYLNLTIPRSPPSLS